MEDDGGVGALLNEVLQRLGAEGRVAAEQRVGDDAQGPHVNGLAVAALQHDLGGGVAERASHGGEDLVLAVEHLGDAKVGEDQVGVVFLCQVEQVLGLEVWWVSGLVGARYRGGGPLGRRTPVDDIVLVEIVDGVEHLPESLRGVLLGELALLADAVEELPARRQLGDDVVLVLQRGSASPYLLRRPAPGPRWAAAYPRLEPVDEAHNVRVLQALQEVQLIVHHALVALDVLLQDDLDGDLALRRVGLADDAIGAGAEGAAELVLGSARALDSPLGQRALGERIYFLS